MKAILIYFPNLQYNTWCAGVLTVNPGEQAHRVSIWSDKNI